MPERRNARGQRRRKSTGSRRDCRAAPSRSSEADVEQRIGAIDWKRLGAVVLEDGHGVMPALLRPAECRALIETYADDRRFRSRVDMARHGFGVGDYAYFAEPLPALVAGLRTSLYERLAPIANAMADAIGRGAAYPATLAEYREHCRRAGQTKPTPLLLRYREGGYNRLHRDLYGDLLFPLQVTVLLSRRGVDFEGGEFVLVENRPRQQAGARVVSLERGDAVVFPVAERPVAGTRATLRATMRHGVSRIDAGERYALGIIFHDAA
jgi:hypothetical protein